MQGVIRLLLVVILGELAYCGYWAAAQLGRYEPVLPQVVHDDPLLDNEFKSLADAARWGNSLDWQTLGEGLLGQGFYGEAELAFRRAVELNPENSLAQFSLAFCIDRTGRVDESSREYLRAIEITKPSKSPVASADHSRYQLGRNALRKEQAAEAERIFHEADAFYPSAYQYAKLLVRSGRAAEALPTIDRVLEAVPNSLKFTALRMHALEQLGRLPEAHAAARKLERSEYVIPMDFSSNFVTPYNKRIGIQKEEEVCEQLWTEKHFDAVARKLNELLVILEPTSNMQKYALRLSLIKVEYNRRDADAILALVERANADGDSDAELLQMEGAAYAIKGNMDRAVELWLRAALMSPNIPLHEFLAKYYDEQGDAVKRDEQLGYAAVLKMKVSYWGNELEAAREAVAAAKKLVPENATVWFYSGEIEQSLGNLDQARTDYARCIELDPSHGRALREYRLLEGV
ncbi:MAG: tetratricopeptide repeat protein [Planctomycetaceae bacterium]|nr:tetratricopeptide repeat protein [Planctomycetaceae bacterium]